MSLAEKEVKDARSYSIEGAAQKSNTVMAKGKGQRGLLDETAESTNPCAKQNTKKRQRVTRLFAF